ncbi:MAG: hypothetical protein IV094_03205 [Vitreoscilla sp.]|nr:hypothetical protein [Vitreoscilla sp.]
MNLWRGDSMGSERRRMALRCAAAGLLVPAVGWPAIAATPFAIRRARFGLLEDFHLPKADLVTLVPFTKVVFQESADCSLQPNGMVRINVGGLYRAVLGLDWVAQNGTDIDLRLYGIRRKHVGAPPQPTLKDDRLASADIPGSDAPRMARFQGGWAPGSVPLGGIVATELTVEPPGIVAIGDMVMAAHTSVADGVIGAEAADALIVRGRVVAADRIRVTIYNPSIAGGVFVPPGELRVLAMNAVETRGESADAWQVVHTASEVLKAGEMIYAIGRNKGMANDYIQATDTTFLQIERFG